MTKSEFETLLCKAGALARDRDFFKRWMASRLVLVQFFVLSAGNLAGQPADELRAGVSPLIRYQRALIRDEESAFVIWRRAISEFQAIEQLKPRDYIAPAELNFPLEVAEAWIELNTNTLALLDQGIARPACQFPYLDQGYHTLLPYLGELLQLADAKLLRAKVRIRKGQYENAAEDLAGLLKMSELVANGEGGLSHIRYGWTIDGRADEGITALLQSSKLSPRILKQLISAMLFRRPPAKTLHDALQCEMECFLLFASEWPDNLTNATETEIIMGRPPKGMKLPQVNDAAWTNRFDIITGRFTAVGYHKALLTGHPNALDKPATIGLFSAYLVHLAQQPNLPVLRQQTNTPCPEMIACQKVEQFWDTIPAIRSNRTDYVHLKGDELIKVQRALAQIDNPLGKQIVWSRAKDFEDAKYDTYLGASEQIAMWQLQREAMKTCIALRLYWEQNGKLPQTLLDLVGCSILDGLPLDPFTGDNLQYSEVKALVWSKAWEKIANDRRLQSYGLKSVWTVSLPTKASNR